MNFSNNTTRSYLKKEAFGTNLTLSSLNTQTLVLGDKIVANASSISSTVLSYLSTVRSNIQSQIDEINTTGGTASIRVGTVTSATSEPTVTNSGNAINAIFDFVVPYVNIVVGTVKNATTTASVSIDPAQSTKFSKS